MNSETFKNLITIKRPRYAKSRIPIINAFANKGKSKSEYSQFGPIYELYIYAFILGLKKNIQLPLPSRNLTVDFVEIGKWKDRWLTHPFPNMSEPEKCICYLTDYNDYDEDHQAWLYNKASLHAIDRFFMQVRRRLSVLERPISSASAANRIWHGYSAYNPESIIKLLEIFRVYYNYCLKGMDGKTPAMRLGLAKGIVSPEDIIYFSEF